MMGAVAKVKQDNAATGLFRENLRKETILAMLHPSVNGNLDPTSYAKADPNSMGKEE